MALAAEQDPTVCADTDGVQNIRPATAMDRATEPERVNFGMNVDLLFI